jgi:chromosome partitioning protein
MQRLIKVAKVIAIANQKGGVGKTTTVINVGAALAEMGKKVLVVDLDPQGNLAIGLGLDLAAINTTIYQVLTDETVNIGDAIIDTKLKGLQVVAADRDLAAARVDLLGQENRVSEVLRDVQNSYDYILLDCPPSLDLLTLCGLVAADSIIIPLQCHYLALKGLNELYSLILKVKKHFNPKLVVSAILPTMYATRTIHSREVLDEIKEILGDKVYDIPVKQTIRFPDSTIAGQPILSFSRNSEAAEVYRGLARKVVKDEQKTVA